MTAEWHETVTEFKPERFAGPGTTIGVARPNRNAHYDRMNRTAFFAATAALAVFTIAPRSSAADSDLAEIKTEIGKRHEEAVKRLQYWIKLPSIAAGDLNSKEGAEYMARLAKEAGFSAGDGDQY